jgi:translation elongation factor EF-Tu-like GTPase
MKPHTKIGAVGALSGVGALFAQRLAEAARLQDQAIIVVGDVSDKAQITQKIAEVLLQNQNSLPHIVLVNKADMLDKELTAELLAKLQQESKLYELAENGEIVPHSVKLIDEKAFLTESLQEIKRLKTFTDAKATFYLPKPERPYSTNPFKKKRRGPEFNR